MIVRWLGIIKSALRRLARGQRGGLLAETVLALGLFGVLGVAVLGGVQTSHIGKRQFEVQSTAENIVRNQLESVFEQNYKPPGETYDAVTAQSGYSVDADSLTYDAVSTDVSIVRITVYYDGQPVKVFETVRTNR